ncbi:MAG: site-specific DNA-methyltransferase, partial [Bacteroides sp.]
MAINYYENFINKLKEIFMMDHAELDFGIYRIMNQKRAEIEHFLRFDLLPQVKMALADAPDSSESEVFSHLVTFFSRYYDSGDFISKRRYKDNTYAIPYNGEEVKLHWANADQYYIKSSEYFRDYSFLLPTSRRKVHFVLKDASTEQNNNKSANNMERRFALYKPENDEEPFYEVNG